MSQMTLPVFMSSAITCASSVAMKSLLPSVAKPRFTMPQQACTLSGRVPLVAPDGPPGARVQSEGAIVLSGAVKHAIDHQRSGLKLAELGSLKRPLHRQIRGVRWVDLIQLAVSPAVVVAGVCQPILRLLRSLQDAIVCDLRAPRQGAENKTNQRHGDSNFGGVHFCSPRNWSDKPTSFAIRRCSAAFRIRGHQGPAFMQDLAQILLQE